MAYTKDVIRIANGEIGYREKRTNHTKYADEVKQLNWAQDQPWCHTFISWLFQQADAKSIAPVTASCAVGVQWFKKQKRFNKTPLVGSIVYYGPHGGTHVELVVKVTSTHITTIGGNTGGSLEGRYFNGDGVYEKEVPRNSSRIYGYGHPDYEPEKKSPRLLRKGMKGADVRNWQKTLNYLGYKIEDDGEFGTETHTATRDFQRSKDIEDDGIVGPATRAKV
jgi:hypothetical protein